MTDCMSHLESMILLAEFNTVISTSVVLVPLGIPVMVHPYLISVTFSIVQ